MKNIKDWKTFNELKTSTYKNAAKLAKKYGRNTLANEFDEHSKNIKSMEMDKRVNEEKAKALKEIDKSVEPFIFKTISGKEIDKLNFMYFDNGMTFDNYVDDVDNFMLFLFFCDDEGNTYTLYINDDYVDLLDNETGEVVDARLISRSDARRLKKLIADNFDVLLKEFDLPGDIREEEYQKIINKPIHYFYGE